MPQPPAPTSIHNFEELAPKGPWFFLKPALGGGFTPSGWGLILGWGLFQLGAATAWAAHLRSFAGWSALPSHWGEQLSQRDVWELLENGGLKQHFWGAATPMMALIGLVLLLWCGWRMQAETAGLQPRLRPWLFGAMDAIKLSLIPMFVPYFLALLAVGWMEGTGIQGLGWAAFFLGPVLFAAFTSAMFMQWSLCRLDRAQNEEELGWKMGGWSTFAQHLRRCFLAMWGHPVQWTVLALLGAAFRMGLQAGVLILAWRMGGGSPGRVWAFLGLQTLVTGVNAWMLGWQWRTIALFWRHDHQVSEVRDALASPEPQLEA